MPFFSRADLEFLRTPFSPLTTLSPGGPPLELGPTPLAGSDATRSFTSHVEGGDVRLADNYSSSWQTPGQLHFFVFLESGPRSWRALSSAGPPRPIIRIPFFYIGPGFTLSSPFFLSSVSPHLAPPFFSLSFTRTSFLGIAHLFPSLGPVACASFALLINHLPIEALPPRLVGVRFSHRKEASRRP